MTLLAPIAGLLAAGLGLATLLLVHALKLRRQPLAISSTLLWRQAARDLEVNIPWRRPRATALLILQALGILALALAIARPVIGDDTSPTGRIIIVLDATASMRAQTGNSTTAFESAARSAADRVGALRRTNGSPEIAVVRHASPPTLLLAPTRSIDAALSAIRGAQPSDQPGDLAALLELLASLDQPGEIEDGPSRAGTLWVFSDARSIRAEDLHARTGEVIVSPRADNAPDNLGIAALHASRDPDDPTTARVFVRIVSDADRAIGVVLETRTQTGVTRTPISIPARDASGVPGSVTRTIAVDAPGSQRIEVRLDHQQRPDALHSDDAAWVTVPDPSPPRTVIVAPDARPDPFLLDVARALAPGRVSTHQPTDLDALRSADLVIYDRVTPTTLPGVPTLGFASAWPGNDQPSMRDQRERIIAWDRAHPVLRDITLASVVFDRAVALPGSGPPPGPGLGSSSGEARDNGLAVDVLAESSTGAVITETIASGHRHLRVAFPLERSNWAVEVGMSIFVAKSFERLAPGTRGEGRVARTADPFEVRARADRVTLTPSDGPATSAPATAQRLARLPAPQRVGRASLEGAEQSEVYFSLLDASESVVNPGNAQPPLDPRVRFGTATPDNATANASAPGRRELWPIALIAAIVLMTGEFLLHIARARI